MHKDAMSGEDGEKGKNSDGAELKKQLSNLSLTAEEIEKIRSPHAFWDTQPVPHAANMERHSGPIDADRSSSDVRSEPLPIPPAFTWVEVDVDDDVQVDEVHRLLADNYVEDEDNMFRFAYAPEFLRWALKPPGYQKCWHLGIRVKTSNVLVAFISGVPVMVRLHGNEPIKMVEINFLCVHKKLRSKRMAPVLIKEITRRVNLLGIWQAIYTAGSVLPTPVAKCQYYHRSLNPRKLVDIGFSSLPQSCKKFRDPMGVMEKMYILPSSASRPYRTLVEEYIPSALQLVRKKLENYLMFVDFDEDDFRHWFMPRESVLSTYVLLKDDDESSREVTDLISFYSLPSSVIDRATGKPRDVLRAAYCYYNVATTMRLQDAMRDSLVLAKKEGYDVFNALDLLDNKEFLNVLKFGIGDGTLQYYIYNYKTERQLKPEEVGIVML